MKSLTKIIISIALFVLYCIFEYICVLGLKLIGIDIFSIDTKITSIILIGINLFLVLIFFAIYHKTIINDLKDYKNNFKSYLKTGLIYWGLGLIIMIICNIFISSSIGTSTNEEAVQSVIKSYPIYAVISSIIVAPFIEELIFRKSIYDCFNGKYDILYIIISGLLFGFVHIVVGGASELIYIIPYGIMGSMFAYMYCKTKNIFTSTFMHMLHNSISVIIYLISFFVI